jgi:hypothetical protein
VVTRTAEAQLDRFLAKYTPEIRAIAEAVLRKMRRLVPGAIELVYDNYNALVIAFGPTERSSELICSIALYPRWVTLFFVEGAKLRDPEKVLKGNGKIVRHVVLNDARDLDQPAVRALIAQAIDRSEKPLEGPRRLIIQSISAKQRPRRPRA